MPWVEISQAAFMMGLSERTIRNWIKSGKINAKTENGRRVVEVPEEEFAQTTGAGAEGAYAEHETFGETEGEAEEGEQALGTQKRLEIALLECGRVKGTLASQERIMETLSSNIAELTAKLQKSQNRNWKLVLACLFIASLGVVAVMASNSVYNTDLNQQQREYDSRLQGVRAELNAAELAAEREANRLREEHKDELAAALTAQKKELEADHQAALDKAESAYERFRQDLLDRLEQSEAALTELREEQRADQKRLLELNQEASTLKDELARQEKRFEDEKRTLEELNRRQKDEIRELQDRINELRRQRLRGLEEDGGASR